MRFDGEVPVRRLDPIAVGSCVYDFRHTQALKVTTDMLNQAIREDHIVSVGDLGRRCTGIAGDHRDPRFGRLIVAQIEHRGMGGLERRIAPKLARAAEIENRACLDVGETSVEFIPPRQPRTSGERRGRRDIGHVALNEIGHCHNDTLSAPEMATMS